MPFDRLQTLLRSSHRTIPEQFVGLAILFGTSAMIQSVTAWTKYGSSHNLLPDRVYVFCTTANFFLLSIGMWSLWRRYSLRILKLEFSLYLAQFVFQIGWSISFFLMHEILLSLVLLLLLWCNTLLAGILFWKKEKLAGQFFLLPFFWIFTLITLNMSLCVTTP